MPPHLVILGQGYSASAVAALWRASGRHVTGTKRALADGPDLIAFDRAETVLHEATHLLVSLPPDESGDPALSRFLPALRAAPYLKWVGYYSTTGVYGDRDGQDVDESTPVAPGQPRSKARIDAEQGWSDLAHARSIACDIMRLGGIYGPGRSAFETLASGKARLIDSPRHLFSRIHRDDIAGATLSAIETAGQTAPSTRILNFVDDTPSPQSAVLEEAARLTGQPLPPRYTLEEAWETLSPMARSFWSERRVVRSRKTQEILGRRWTYPGYREGLAAILSGYRS